VTFLGPCGSSKSIPLVGSFLPHFGQGTTLALSMSSFAFFSNSFPKSMFTPLLGCVMGVDAPILAPREGAFKCGGIA
jgi:hypothetical protein